jgi:2-polyprenyl-3-methyl-5-hydroxy-6-metoxy-1,4-benzoquinol methylase
MYNYLNCPSCGETQFAPWLLCEDHTVSHEKFQIVSCETCTLRFTNPIPDLDKLGEYYKSEDYISHSNTRKGLIAQLYHRVRKQTLKSKLQLISSLVSRGAIVDYGCGTGAFLNTCWQAGWKAFGVEPDKGARKIAFESGLNVSESKEVLDQKTKDLKVNAITMWHVLEHVSDLKETLQFFKGKLSREGVLVVAVPNYQSLDAKIYREFWAAYDVPRHLYHFDKNSIVSLMKDCGFSLTEVHPMKFDSFYVSMLSEKYKNGKINYLKAFINGMKSNFTARKGGEYSSLIYVFQ